MARWSSRHIEPLLPSSTTTTPTVRKRTIVETVRATPLKALGRGRRVTAKILHGLRYAPTATPLVRKRTVVELDQTARVVAARLGRGRRIRAQILRGVSVVTATPLVRKRVVQNNEAVDRASRIAGRVGRGRRRIFLAAGSRIQRRVPPQIVNDEAQRRASRVAGRLLRGRRRVEALRAPSVPTATPLVRRRVVVELDQTARTVAARLGRGRRISAKILRGVSTVTATPLVRRRVIVETDARPAAWARLGRARRSTVKILRAKLPGPLPFAKPKITVRSGAVQARTQLRARARRDIAVLRSRVFATRPRPTLVTRTRRRKLTHRKPVVLHAPVAAQSPVQRRQVVCDRRAAGIRAHRAHRTVYVRPPHATGVILTPPPYLEGPTQLVQAGADTTTNAFEGAGTVSVFEEHTGTSVFEGALVVNAGVAG